MQKSIIKRFLTGLLLVVLIVSTFCVPAFTQFESSAGSAILMETSTGQILYEKNAEASMPPASITKIMTLLLGFEALESGKVKWDEMVTVSEAAWRMEGSRMFLEVGTKVKFGDIMTGISVVSANDGCVALAEHLYGSESAFVQAMNQRAKELGLTGTHFKNSNGLPAEGHVMTAKDIAVLARHLINSYPRIIELESQKEYTFNNIRQYNRNPLLNSFPGADGLKTGWTNEAGYCLVGTAKQNDIRMLSVVLNTKDEKERLKASQELLTYGFNNFELVTAKQSGTIVDTVDVKNGKELTVPVKVDDTITVLIPSSRKDDIKVSVSKDIESLDAPVSSNIRIGTLEIQLDGQALGTADISTAEDVPKAGFFELLWRSIVNFFKSLF